MEWAALAFSVVAILVAGASALYTKQQATAARDQVELDRERRRDELQERLGRQRARATRLDITIESGPMVSAGRRTVSGRESLKLHNRGDVPVTDIGIGQTERQSPHKGLGWVPFLAADATERVSLPDGYEHIQVTWRDIDDVQWCREFIEQDFVLKRLSAPADD